MAAWLTIPLGILATLYTGKELGDLIALAKGKGGLEEMWGAEPSREQLAELAIAEKRGKAKGLSRVSRMEEVTALKDRAEAFLLGAGGMTEMGQARQGLQAVARGSSIANILPAGMRPGALLQQMQMNKVEAWRKMRDSAPSDVPLAEAAKAGAARPPRQSRLAQLVRQAGPVNLPQAGQPQQAAAQAPQGVR